VIDPRQMHMPNQTVLCILLVTLRRSKDSLVTISHPFSDVALAILTKKPSWTIY
jgi:hypothetical protein